MLFYLMLYGSNIIWVQQQFLLLFFSLFGLQNKEFRKQRLFYKIKKLMDQSEDIPLSKNTKILFNLIQIRLFDISQLLQVGGHKLSLNQIKQTLEKQHNIFAQVEKVFEELKINKLYDLMKHISQNYTSIATILIENKFSKNNIGKNQLESQKNQNEQLPKSKFQKIDKTLPNHKNSPKQSKVNKSQTEQSQESITKTLQNLKTHQFQLRNKLGGIHLFNQNYKRGVQTLQQKHQAWGQKKRKNYGQKQLILQLISKEITHQVDVQKLHDNDQISKFIKEGKVKHELYNHIEYEKELESISIFLKQSQQDAMKFLMDTKKAKQEIDSKDNQDQIVVNYHELIEMLVQKKKTEYQAIQTKVKQIIDTLKLKLQMGQKDLLLKQAQIKDLEYKLKKKQGVQIGSQTVGLRRMNSKSQPDAMEQLQIQHKAIVQLLKKNLEQSQREILLLETDVRINQQRLKKKQLQITDLNTEIQKLKLQLKETNQKKIDKNNKNTSKVQKQMPIDPILQSSRTNQNANARNSFNSQQQNSSHKKRKPKHSFFGNSLISSLTTNNETQKQKTEEEGTKNNDNQQQQNQQKAMTNKPTIKNSAFFNNKKKSSQIKNQQHQLSQQEKIQNMNNFQNEQNQIIQDSYQKNNSESQSFKRGTSKNMTNKSLNHSLKNGENKKQIQKQFQNFNKKQALLINTQKNNQLSTKAKQKSLIKQGSFQDSQNSFTKAKMQRNVSEQKSEIKNSFRMQNQINTPKILTQNEEKQELYFQQEAQSHEVSQKSQNQLLSMNIHNIQKLLFDQISLIQKQGKTSNQSLQLQIFLTIYDQKELNFRLKKIISLLNLAKNSQRQFLSSGKRLSTQQKETNQSFDTQSLKMTKNKSGKENLNNLQFLKRFENVYQNVPAFRNVKANTDIEQWEKQKLFAELSKNKLIKDFTKNFLTNHLFKNLKRQLTVNGKALNFTKKQFLQICQKINIQENLQDLSSQSSESQISNQQNQHISKNDQSATKIKIIKNVFKSKPIKKYQDSGERSLQIQGVSMEFYEQQQQNLQKQKTFRGHIKKLSQSMKNLFTSSKNNEQKHQNLIKVQKIQSTKHQSDHFIIKNQQNKQIQESNSQEIKILKRAQIKKIYKTLKDQGSKIQSLQNLQQVITKQKLSLKDLIKITALLITEKSQNLPKMFQDNCNESCKIKNKAEHSSKLCCNHLQKYSSFLEKVSTNQQWLKKIKKKVFTMHILNIDGKDRQNLQFKGKKLSKQKSIARMDLSSTNSQSILKSFQTQSFYTSSKRNEQITSNRQALKKAGLNSHLELKQRKTFFEAKSKLRNGQPTNFLPQLGNRSPSQSIKY